MTERNVLPAETMARCCCQLYIFRGAADIRLLLWSAGWQFVSAAAQEQIIKPALKSGPVDSVYRICNCPGSYGREASASGGVSTRAVCRLLPLPLCDEGFRRAVVAVDEDNILWVPARCVDRQEDDGLLQDLG